ncbi:hypothetical protein ACWKWK_10115 [Pseudoxanthomonas beigongshangi]
MEASGDWLVRLAGVHSLGFALFHLGFWKLFRWKEELAKVGFATRAITQILNLRLIYLFLGVGVACFAFTGELQHSGLGRAMLAFMVLFWAGRTIEQFVFLRRHHWLLHVLTALFVLGALLFALPLLLLFPS